MILSLFRFKVAPTKKADVVDIFDYISGKISGKQGCNYLNLYSAVENENSLIYLEEWDSQSDLWTHIRSNDFGKIMTAMDLAIEAPHIKFHTVCLSHGFELVEKLRR